MALSRRLGVVAILGSCWFTAVACGDDDSSSPSGSEAGAGGEGGDADGNGSAGSKNTAGKAGMSTAGTAGTPNGGNAGTAGTSPGDGGTAGSFDPGVGGEGGVGGESNTSPPMGGAGGDGGSGATSQGGEGGVPAVTELKICAYSCQTDDDCKVGQDGSNKCDPTTKTCGYPPECAETIDCVPAKSFWLFNCESDADCIPDSEACVTFNGVGYCAEVPTDGQCFFGGVPEQQPHQGAQGTVEACIERTYVCNTGACVQGCLAFGCDEGVGDTCNETTGLCECAQASECAKGVCGADHHCAECATSADCAPTAAQTGRDVCVDGKCGCSGANKCPASPFKAATAVCQ
jgi:hypothetical protein